MLAFISGFFTGVFLASAGFIYLLRATVKRVLTEASGKQEV
jgi:hypothetical protein